MTPSYDSATMASFPLPPLQMFGGRLLNAGIREEKEAEASVLWVSIRKRLQRLQFMRFSLNGGNCWKPIISLSWL